MCNILVVVDGVKKWLPQHDGPNKKRIVELIGENNLRIYCCSSNTGQSQKKRVKRNGETEKGPQAKNTVALLNELRKSVVYEVETQSGPVHAPVFTMSVMVSLIQFFFLFFLQTYMRYAFKAGEISIIRI